MLRLAVFVVLALSAAAADWTEYRIGPLRVISDAGDNDARTRLAEMEQIRYVMGRFIGKSALGNDDLKAIWPITLVLFGDRRDAQTYAIPAPFIEGGSANLSVAYKGDPPEPAWRSEIARQLIEANAARMPAEIETALCDLFSTIAVDATRVSLGAPLPAGSVSEGRRKEWAKLHLLATGDEYAGRFRVYLGNLQGGDLQLAARNTFAVSFDELERRMNAYASAGNFRAAPVFGKALNPRRDFYERRLTNEEVNALLDELKSGGKRFPMGSPRGLLAAGTRDALQRAADLNPLWGEPHARIAALEPVPKLKVERLLLATQREPRKMAYWEALAQAQTAAEMYAEASKSWISAERAAPSDAERNRVRQQRAGIEDKRIEAELAAARRARDQRDADVRRVMEESDARISAAADAANRANREKSGAASNQAPVTFQEAFGGTPTVRGMLTRVDCIEGMMRLIIQQTGAAEAILRMPVQPENGPSGLACGAQDPPRRIDVTHNAKPDPKLGTAGDIVTFELR
jgi:hypothetical protein